MRHANHLCHALIYGLATKMIGGKMALQYTARTQGSRTAIAHPLPDAAFISGSRVLQAAEGALGRLLLGLAQQRWGRLDKVQRVDHFHADALPELCFPAGLLCRRRLALRLRLRDLLLLWWRLLLLWRGLLRLQHNAAELQITEAHTLLPWYPAALHDGNIPLF
jgi:hypothetical protein